MATGIDKNNAEVVLPTHRTSWLNPFMWAESWKASSMAKLAQAERKILASIWDKLESKFVSICNGTKIIRTVGLNTESKNIPLVLVHGMGAGVGLWILNLEALSKNRPLYAFDVLGFGRSSRTKFNKDAQLSELELVESVEEWRKSMGLDKFILLGHSLGGFIASSYAIRYPEKVRHLILVDPWGFPEKPSTTENRLPVPVWIKVVVKILQPFNPLAILRVAGPMGPGLVARFRSDLTRKFSHLFDDDTVSEYIYHCNAQTPSGEVAFKHMTIPFGWAKYPMINRICELPRSLPMTVLYGSRSWVDSGVGHQIKYLRNNSYVDVQVVKGAGHHVYLDKAYQFNSMVTRVCQMAENRMDFGQPFTQPIKRSRSRNSDSSSPQTSPGSGYPMGGRRHLKSESMPTFDHLRSDALDQHQSRLRSDIITEQGEISSTNTEECLCEETEHDPPPLSFTLGGEILAGEEDEENENDIVSDKTT